MWSNKDMHCGKVWMQKECQIWDMILNKLLVCLDYWWVLELGEISRGNKKDSFKVSVLGERKIGNALTDMKQEGRMNWSKVLFGHIKFLWMATYLIDYDHWGIGNMGVKLE